MIVLLHVSIALLSVGFTTLTAVRPSLAKLRASYGLIGATLASGTYLVVSTHSPLLSSCVTGLVYITAMTAGILVTHTRLAKTQA